MSVAHDLRSIDCEVRGITLRGTAYVPEREFSAGTTVILYHGFGGHRIEASRAFVQLARALAAEQISVVAFDRAGHGESDGDFYDTTVSGDIEDSLELLQHITALDFVDSDDLHLLGLSMGGVVASVVAAEADATIRSLTLWSVAAVFADEIRGGTLQGKSTQSVARDGYFDFRGLRLGPNFLADASNFDVYGRARGYDGPVRVLHGDLDFIPASYAEAYGTVYGDAMDFTLFHGADHTWETVTARDFVINESIAFITAHSSSPNAA